MTHEGVETFLARPRTALLAEEGSAYDELRGVLIRGGAEVLDGTTPSFDLAIAIFLVS